MYRKMQESGLLAPWLARPGSSSSPSWVSSGCTTEDGWGKPLFLLPELLRAHSQGLVGCGWWLECHSILCLQMWQASFFIHRTNIYQDLTTLVPQMGPPASARDAGGRLGFNPGWEDTLEEEMATRSTIFAWKSLWTGEPDKLQCMGLQRVRHYWTHTMLVLLLLLPARQIWGL